MHAADMVGAAYDTCMSVTRNAGFSGSRYNKERQREKLLTSEFFI